MTRVRYLEDVKTGLITRVKHNEIDLKWIKHSKTLTVHEFDVNSAEHTLFLLRYSDQLGTNVSEMLERVIITELDPKLP